MGYSRAEIEESLSQAKYDDIFATYLLLGRKSNDVCIEYVIKLNNSLHYYSECSLINIKIIFVLYSLKVMVLGQVAHCH